MDKPIDYKRFAILYVDDEEKSLKYFARAFEDQFRILTALTAREGLETLDRNRDAIGLLMSDQRMPGEKGTWLLEKAREVCPRVVRILATAFADMDAAIAAVNTGAIYKYVTKPWDPPQLEMTLKRGLEFFMVQRERDQLVRERVATLHNLMVADRVLSLGLMASGLSHHIRNALVAVKTFLDLTPAKLMEEGIDPARTRQPDFWRDYHQDVQRQLERINRMLRELSAISDLPLYGFHDRVRLRQVVSEVVERLSQGLAAKRIVVEVSVPDDLPDLTVDKPRFTRIFELLVQDELVTLPAGSRFSITATAAPLAAGGVPEIEVTLRDNGPGLPDEVLRLVFDPFQVRADAPLEYGINLMSVYFLVHHHGGRIVAQSHEGQGTSFVLRLPVNASQPRAPQDDEQFMQQAMVNEALWDKLLRTK